MVHRQDIYRAREYRPDTGPAGFLDACFSRHFEGRPYLEHLQYVWFTFNPAREGRAGVLKGGGPGAAGGVRYHPPATEDLPGRLARFELACAEFISVLCSAPGYGAQRVRGTELEGGPGAGDGLLQEYLRWFGGPLDGTDISLAGDGSLERDSRRLFCCSFCHADDFPGEVSNTFTVRSLSDSQTRVLLSGGGALGSELFEAHWPTPGHHTARVELSCMSGHGDRIRETISGTGGRCPARQLKTKWLRAPRYSSSSRMPVFRRQKASATTLLRLFPKSQWTTAGIPAASASSRIPTANRMFSSPMSGPVSTSGR